MSKIQKYIVTEQVFLCFDCEASSEAEAREKYEEYIRTNEGKIELLKDALAHKWDDNVEVNIDN